MRFPLAEAGLLHVRTLALKGCAAMHEGFDVARVTEKVGAGLLALDEAGESALATAAKEGDAVAWGGGIGGGGGRGRGAVGGRGVHPDRGALRERVEVAGDVHPEAMDGTLNLCGDRAAPLSEQKRHAELLQPTMVGRLHAFLPAERDSPDP